MSLALSCSYTLIGSFCATAAMRLRISRGVAKVRASMSSVEMPQTWKKAASQTAVVPDLLRNIFVNNSDPGKSASPAA